MNKKNQNFFLTFILTLILLIAIVIVVEKLFGASVAGIIGTITAGIALKYFEKLDLKPTFLLKSPAISKSTTYSTLISILILLGCISIVKGLLQYAVIFFGEDVVCNKSFLFIVFLFDWGSYIVAGLLIGKIYPKRALTLTFIAAFTSFIILYPEIYLEDSFKKLACLFDDFSGEYTEDFSDGFTLGAKVGAVIGFIIRGYIAILFAKISSKRLNNIKSI